MTKVLIDGVERQAVSDGVQWTTLLDDVDRDLATKGRIVIEVKIDGVDAPAFRDAAINERALAAAVVELTSGTERDLVTDCLREATMGVEALRAAALSVGAAFRRHELAVAHDGLCQIAAGLTTLIAVLQAIALAGRVDVEGGVSHAVTLINELSSHVEAVIAAQGNQDWLTVADVLEYDIEPSLKRWTGMLAAIDAPDTAEPLRAAS
jgi:hypothetical protein